MMMDDFDDDDNSNKIGKLSSGKRRTTRNESEKRRRDKLNVYITELASMVPKCEAARKKLDKTTILKMAVNYMRIHNDLTGSILGQENGLHLSFLTSDEIGQLMDESLNGFLFVLSNTGEIVYVSKSITPLLGLKWDQLKGSSFTNLVHPDDQTIVTNELDEDTISVLITPEPIEYSKSIKPTRHSFEIRMACNPGNQRIENNGSYERVRVIGYTDTWEAQKAPSSEEVSIRGTEIAPMNEMKINKPCFFVAVGCLSRPAPQRFVEFDESTTPEFDSRHTMDGKFLFVDPRSISMTGYWPYELLGTSVYNYIHHDDMNMLASFHQSLLEFGEGKTEPYRMRSKGEQWVWMKSRSFISYNHWNSKPEFFCSKNMAICDKQELFPPQEKSYTYNTPQLQASSKLTSDHIYLQQDVQHLQLLPNLTAEIPQMMPPQPEVNRHGGGTELASRSSDDQSRGHSVEDDSDSIDSVDLSMSYEDLEGFIEAQRQLHDQLILKHTILEEAIIKQKHQLQAVQQQMLLNLQAQLTLEPSKSQQLFEEQFRKAKEFSELHQQQENKQMKLLQTLKETRKRVEKRNRRHLKYYREKQPRLNTPESSFTSSFTQGVSEMTRSSLNQRPVRVSQERNQVFPSLASTPEQYDSVKQVENIQTLVQSQSPLLQETNAQGQQFASPTFSPQSQQGQSARLTSTTILASPNVENTTGQASSSVLSSREHQIKNRSQEPTTLSNIQNLLTASSQNPQAMQNLLSGLRSQPEVAQTLLDLLKQAQASETSEKDSLLFNQSLQNTTEQFSAALNTTILSTDPTILNRSTTSPSTYHTHFGEEEIRQQQQRQHQEQQQQQKQLEQEWHHHQVQTQQRRQRINNPLTSRKQSNQMRSEIMSTSSENSFSTWMSSLPTETPRENPFPQSIMDNFASMNQNTNASLEVSRSSVPKDKQKEQGQPKDYFSTFSSKELEAMFLTSSPNDPTSASEEGSATSAIIEDRKLQEEETSHSALLVQQQQLLQMHQEQRKQLLIRQQEQLLMSFQQTKPPHTSTAATSNQDMFVSFSQNQNQNSSQSLLANSQPGTSSAGQAAQSSTNNPETSQPSTSWDSESANFELNDADDVVLNMLLTQSSMDTLFDSNPWPETDSLLEYLNMNPDLTSD